MGFCQVPRLGLGDDGCFPAGNTSDIDVDIDGFLEHSSVIFVTASHNQ